jgi:hypothetical protein
LELQRLKKLNAYSLTFIFQLILVWIILRFFWLWTLNPLRGKTRHAITRSGCCRFLYSFSATTPF